MYRAVVSRSTLSGIAGRNQLFDLFDVETLALFDCTTNEFMELEVESPGFKQFGRTRTGAFTLSLKYAPDLIDETNKIAYLYPLHGRLVFHDDEGPRAIDLAAGNHGHVASKAYQHGEVLKLDLGVALRNGSKRPALARLIIECTLGGDRCSKVNLMTAIDPDGRVMSPVTLSTIFDGEGSAESTSDKSCPSYRCAATGWPDRMCCICPNCHTDGCTQFVGICCDAGAPIGCT